MTALLSSYGCREFAVLATLWLPQLGCLYENKMRLAEMSARKVLKQRRRHKHPGRPQQLRHYAAFRLAAEQRTKIFDGMDRAMMEATHVKGNRGWPSRGGIARIFTFLL